MSALGAASLPRTKPAVRGARSAGLVAALLLALGLGGCGVAAPAGPPADDGPGADGTGADAMDPGLDGEDRGVVREIPGDAPEAPDAIEDGGDDGETAPDPELPAEAEQDAGDAWSEGASDGLVDGLPEEVPDPDVSHEEGSVEDDATGEDGSEEDAPDAAPLCSVFHRDDDGDGFGVAESRCLEAPAGAFTAIIDGDCDDVEATIHPGAGEDCLTEWDDDCDGDDNARDGLGCRAFFPDVDGDGFGAEDAGECWCRAFAGLAADVGGDCDDDEPAVHPGADETCDGRDEDCDGRGDDGDVCPVLVYYCDADGDGHPAAMVSGSCSTWSCLPSACSTTPGDDCDDVEAGVHPGADETCNGRDDDCGDGADEGRVCEGQAYFCDADLDGHASAAPTGTCSTFGCVPGGCGQGPGDDCDDGEGAVHPGADETCNGVDDNCASGADEGGACTQRSYYCDGDGDGYTSLAPTAACARYDCIPGGCDDVPGGDCDDGEAMVHPGASEVCNGRDDDCQDGPDQGDTCPLAIFFCDVDLDGQRTAVPTGACRGPACVPAGCLDLPGLDCDDGDPEVRPGAVEACNGRDDDCDGGSDGPGICTEVAWYCDLDGDGARSAEPSGTCATFGCVPAGCGTEAGGDCNDHDGTVHGGRQEDCATLADDDCDGSTDAADAEGCIPWYRDEDGDGFAAEGAASLCRCGPDGAFVARATGDCDDGDPDVHPAAVEACNQADDDCDGAADEGDVCLSIRYYCDLDGDYYLAAQPSGAVADPAGIPEGCRTSPGRDCDDGASAVHPGAQEDCATPADDDCSGSADARNAANCVPWYRDLDQDTYGIPGDSQCRCAPLAPYTAPTGRATDCADSNPAIHPGAAEACNGIDDDCDGQADGIGVCPVLAWYCDRDGDGEFASAPAGTCDTFRCVPAECRDTPGADCNDSDDSAYPGAIEDCDGIDDDCDGVRDGPGVCPAVAFHCDADGDSHVALVASGSCGTFGCVPAGCSTSPGDDCDDARSGVHPGSTEACNGIDDDCDSVADEPGTCSVVPYYCDSDRDGHLSALQTGTCERFGCIPSGCSLAAGDDCNDNGATVHPGEPESCNGLDDDCVGGVDDGGVCPFQEFHCDRDGDGHRSRSPTDGCGAFACVPAGCTPVPGDDCDDTRATRHPGASEPCNGLDDDCDDAIDEGNCVIGDRCVDAGAVHPEDPCQRCDPGLDQAAWSPGEGLPCDDGRAFTVEDTCTNGVCQGQPAPCFDGLVFGDACRVQSLQVGTDGNPGQGLDIDGNPATCKPDGTYSDGRPLCSGGVDNQLSLIDEVVNPELAKQLQRGWQHLVFEFGGPAPGPFPLYFFLGRVDPALPGCDFNAPGCDYQIDISQYDALCRPLLALDNATLQGTMLVAGGPGERILLSMPLVGSTVVDLTLYNARLEATATIEAGHVTGFDGILGGALNKAEVFAALALVPDADLPMPKDQIYILLNLLLKPDIDVDGDGTKDSISMGLLARGDRATITGVFQR